jgi:hypothetical protein
MLIDWVITDLTVRLTPEEVWRCLGPAGNAKDSLSDDVADAAAEASALCAPVAAARSLQVTGTGRGKVAFESGIEANGRMLPHIFDGASGGVFLLATVGPEIEGRTGELFTSDDPVRAVIMDAAGSAAAMNLFSQLVQRVVEELHTAGLKAGPCVKPGTDAWNIEGQRSLFRAIPAEMTRVRLLDSLLMSPQKSQSGLVPFGESLRVVHNPGASPCRTCSAGRCPMRVEAFSGRILGA